MSTTINYKRFAFLVALGVLILLAIGGFTWRLYPLILLVPVLGWVFYRKRSGTGVFIATLIIFGLTVFIHFLFPVVSFPTPTGSYQVGVRYEKIQTQRPELMTEDPTDLRTLYLKIWYPAEIETTRTKYIEGGMKVIERLAGALKLPPLILSQMLKTKTNSYKEAPPAKGKFPLVTYSHGYGSFFGQNTPLMEQLASEGYMVAAICHSHQALFGAASEEEFKIFPELVPLEASPDTLAENAYMKVLETSISQDSLNAYSDTFFKGLAEINNGVDIWAQDIVSAIKYIEDRRGDPQVPLYDEVITDSIVSIGMSFGGAASVQAALLEPRIKAAVNMDGSQYGSVLVGSVPANVLFLEARRNINGLTMYGHVFDNIRGSINCIQFANAGHLNFSDLNLFSPVLQYLGIVGKVDGSWMSDQITSIISDFIQHQFVNQRFDADKFAIPEEILVIR